MCVSQTLTMSKAGKVLLTSMQVSEIILSEEYSEYTDVFSEEEMSQLADNTKVSHAIDIKKGKKPLYESIYPLSVEELQVLREYIASSMIKSWIQKSTSPAGSLILFVKK